MESIIQQQEQHNNKTTLAFWIYLMTDLVSFAALFAAFAVLRNNTYGGPTGEDIFKLPFVLTETFVLLMSSFTCGLTMLAVSAQKKTQVLTGLIVTLLLGSTFLVMELTEFSHLVREGNGPQRSAFLSSYFALVGAHGLHIAAGLLWLLILTIYIIRKGLTPSAVKKLTLASLFWHFLDIVWIFIFTVVYLMGVL